MPSPPARRQHAIESTSEIARLRGHAGMTQAELASRLGVTSLTVSRWERGDRKPRYLPVIISQIRAIVEKKGG